MMIISTLVVNCQDCHRCVRCCPVKAIGIENGHARLVEERCIMCGRCVVECPQKAKQIINQSEAVQAAIKSGRKIVLSIAPSFISSFCDYSVEEFLGLLYKIGFTFVEETAVGAQAVSRNYSQYIDTADATVISSCCPVVVNLIEKYYPQLINNLAPIISPMGAHARMLRAEFGQEAFIVFAGPCIAKQDEAKQQYLEIDAVLTFEEIRRLCLDYQKSHVNTSDIKCEKVDSAGAGRYYPIPGGMLKSMLTDDKDDMFAISGIEECKEVFREIASGEIRPKFVEALACRGGCIAGPVNGNSQSNLLKKALVTDYAKQRGMYCRPLPDNQFDRQFKNRLVFENIPSEIQVREVLRKIGKYKLTDEKNCGACGYNSCHDNAVAILQGLAEPNMCIPYMRSKAESFANIIVDNSLNAIIAVDENMIIQEFNQAAERLFAIEKRFAMGSCLTKLLDCTAFFQSAKTNCKIIAKRVSYLDSGLILDQMIVPVKEHGLIIGIFTDVTVQERQAADLAKMRTDTVYKVSEIINKQMKVAQEIAGLLGETTAETKSALLEVADLLKEKGEN